MFNCFREMFNCFREAKRRQDFISPMFEWKEESMKKLEEIIMAAKEVHSKLEKEFQKPEQQYQRILRRYRCAHMYFWLNEAAKVLYENLFSLVSKIEITEKILIGNEKNAEKWLESIKTADKLIPLFTQKLQIKFPESNKSNETKKSKTKNAEIHETSEKIIEKQNILENGCSKNKNISCLQENGNVDFCPKTKEWSIWRGKVCQVVKQTLTAFYNLRKFYKNEERIEPLKYSKRYNKNEKIWQIYKMSQRSDNFDLMVELIEELKKIEGQIEDKGKEEENELKNEENIS
uniref:Uncharacterized protein n=2 Tax=Meloidogyne hapla TaxID=6305 RepID=A0A1I8AXH3_MELHA